jgi:hypothetical protein
MSEAKKVDSFSLKSRREEASLFLVVVVVAVLSVAVAVEVMEEQGIAL